MNEYNRISKEKTSDANLVFMLSYTQFPFKCFCHYMLINGNAVLNNLESTIFSMNSFQLA